MDELIYVLKMVQFVQCESLGTEISFSIIVTTAHFVVSVQRSDLDCEVVYSERFYSTDTQDVNVKKFASLYAFVVDEASRLGYTLVGNKFIRTTAGKQAG